MTKRVSFHTAPKLSVSPHDRQLDCAETDLHSGGLGKSDPPASSPHPDSPKPITKCRNNCIRIKIKNHQGSPPSGLCCTWQQVHETGINTFRPNCVPRLTWQLFVLRAVNKQPTMPKRTFGTCANSDTKETVLGTPRWELLSLQFHDTKEVSSITTQKFVSSP